MSGILLGLSGLAGSGKDTLGDYLVQHHGYVRVALADPLKRFCKEVFNFSDDQLWGASVKRNAPDWRWPRKSAASLGAQHGWLTPRHALQQLGTDWGRECSPDVWVCYCIRVAKAMLSGGHYYDPRTGLHRDSFRDAPRGVVVTDARFANEVAAIHEAGGRVVRLLRGEPMPGAAGQHESETEGLAMPRSMFDAVIDNRNQSVERTRIELASIIAEWEAQ